MQQNSKKTEEILSKLDKTTDIAERLGLLIDLSSQYWQDCDYQEALKIARSARSVAESIGDRKNLSEALYLIALNHNYLNEYSSALNFYFDCLKLCKEIKNRSLASECLNNIGTLFYSMQDYDNALKYFNQALEFTTNQSRILNNISAVYIAWEQYDKSLQYSLESYEKLANTKARSKIIALLNISIAYINLQEYEKAYNSLKEAIELATKRSDDTLLLAHYKMAAFLIDYNIADAYQHLEIALECAEKNDNKERKLMVYRTFAEYYQRKRSYKRANEYLEKYIALKENLLNETMMDKLAQLHHEHKKEVEVIKYERLLEKTARLTSITTITSGIVHEIYQPLSVINLNVENVLYGLKQVAEREREEISEYLNSIKRSIHQINEIITQMKNFYSTQESPQSEMVPLNEVIQKCINLMKYKIYAEGVIYQLDLSPTELKINFVPTYLEQIIVILLMNAIQALKEEVGNGKTIFISTFRKDEEVILSVRDTGPGIPEELKVKIFEPFFSTKPLSQEQGTGLGLAIVKTFMEKYDGRVEVDNCQPQGARFTLTFKIADEEQQ